MDWKENYSYPYGSWALDFRETYDSGYLIGGRIWQDPTTNYRGYVVKTDINGNKLWQKVIDGNKFSYFQTIDKTSDGGFIAGGTYNTHDDKIDAFVMKFNACAEPEWCSLIPDNSYNAPSSIQPFIFEVPNEGYFVQRALLDGSGPQYNWALAKLRLNGSIEWMNNYIVDNPDWAFNSQLDLRVNLTSDTCILACGFVYDTVYSWGGWSTLPHWYKVDKNGNLLWETKWNITEAESLGEAEMIVEDKNGNYYSSGFKLGPYGRPFIYKLSHTGDTLYSKQIIDHPNSIGGKAHELSILNDTSLFISTQFGLSTADSWWSLNITDTLGNKRKGIYAEENFIFVKSHITHNNKIMLLGVGVDIFGNYPTEWFHLHKFNTNLEYDSIYTMPRTYDSLCPHPIASDTIPMPGNCITVSLPEAPKADETMQLKVYPNPASEFVTVEVPEFSVNTIKTGLGRYQQFHPLTGEVELSLINLSGQIVKTEVFDASERNHVINVNSLAPGMYMVHLTQKGKFVAQGKVMVVR
jgi:hypothetical protein